MCSELTMVVTHAKPLLPLVWHAAWGTALAHHPACFIKPIAQSNPYPRGSEQEGLPSTHALPPPPQMHLLAHSCSAGLASCQNRHCRPHTGFQSISTAPLHACQNTDFPQHVPVQGVATKLDSPETQNTHYLYMDMHTQEYMGVCAHAHAHVHMGVCTCMPPAPAQGQAVRSRSDPGQPLAWRPRLLRVWRGMPTGACSPQPRPGGCPHPA